VLKPSRVYKSLVPLAVALRFMLVETEAKVATAAPAEKAEGGGVARVADASAIAHPVVT
jgi:hypothetical protein